MCISTPSFRFLDILNFLAQGLSYSKFLKAFGTEEGKGFFPYEWLDDVTKLQHPELPPYEAFYSTLKQGYMCSPEEYEYLQTVWENQNMQTVQDLLVWYNNLDVIPFVEAVTKMQHFYSSKGLDMFKVSISVPGLARRILFDKAGDTKFALVDKDNQDLYYLIKKNIVGGPSIIFHRHHKKDETFIRGNPDKPCKTIEGFDCNALYLWAIGQPMPTGSYVRRHSNHNFKPLIQNKYMDMFHWMDFIAEQDHVAIQHKLNTGHEKRVGSYFCDGYCEGPIQCKNTMDVTIMGINGA